jgi:competence protein ComEC
MQQGHGSSQTPGLLPWQILLVYGVLGLASARFFLPALVAGCLFGLGLWRTGNWPGLSRQVISFLAGLLAAWVLLAEAPPLDRAKMPEWMAKRREVLVRARVERVDTKPENRLQIILDRPHFRIDGEKGRLSMDLSWNWYEPERTPSPGDTVRAHFRIEPVRGHLNPGTWDTRFYWARQGVGYSTSSEGDEGIESWRRRTNSFWRARRAVVEKVASHTGKSAGGGILLALLCGDKSGLSYDQLNLIRRASLSHVLAQSGLHLGFLAALGWGLARALGRIRPEMYLVLPRQRLAALAALPLVAFYLWLGGFKPSLLRASLMFFFWGLLLWRGRGQVLMDGLFAAVLVMVLVWPTGIFDLGLQLSVTAVAGIVLLWPRTAGWLSRRLPSSMLHPASFYPLSVLGISLVVNAALFPLLLWYFGQVSPHVYLNLLWLPALAFGVMPLGLGGLVLAFVPGLEAVAGFLLQFAGFILQQLFELLQVIDRAGWLWAEVLPRPRWPEMLGYWTLLACAALLPAHGIRRLWPLGLGAAALLLLPFAHSALTQQPRLSLRLFDVGQGQALMLQTPQKRLLVDGGGSWNKDYDVGRLVLSPALSWGRRTAVDSVVLTHPDFDHMRGLYFILRTYGVERFLYNGRWPEDWDGRVLGRILEERDIPARAIRPGEAVDLGRGLHLEVLHAADRTGMWDPNNSSLILRVAHGQRTLALLPGDAERGLLRGMARSGLDLEAELLVLPHHGSRSSQCPAFYREVDPDLALASCGFLNHFRFPHEEVEKALEKQDVPLLTTAQEGSIRVSWHGPELEMRVETQRGIDDTLWPSRKETGSRDGAR